MIRLERMSDYRGVRLERFHCTFQRICFYSSTITLLLCVCPISFIAYTYVCKHKHSYNMRTYTHVYVHTYNDVSFMSVMQALLQKALEYEITIMEYSMLLCPLYVCMYVLRTYVHTYVHENLKPSCQDCPREPEHGCVNGIVIRTISTLCTLCMLVSFTSWSMW